MLAVTPADVIRRSSRAWIRPWSTRATPLSQPYSHCFIGRAFGKVGAARHQDRMEIAVSLIEGQVGKHPHATGTTQALGAARYQDAVIAIFLVQKVIGGRKDIEGTGNDQRLDALKNHQRDFTCCHLCSIPSIDRSKFLSVNV